MISLVDKNKCSGCSACFNVCKYSALSMETDIDGFWYPKIDSEKCVKCGLCEKVCPALEKPIYNCTEPRAFIVQSMDDDIRRQSTSGGAFTEIAKETLKRGGVVFGAAIDDNFNVFHIGVEYEDELAKFRNSKYVQSRIDHSYNKAEMYLKQGREVCFSGTPCQIYALKKYLGKEFENLVTVDFMCRAVPSPKILNKYLVYQKEKYPTFDRIVFRDKVRGYSYSGVALYEGQEILYRAGSELDPWLRLFLGGYCNRESCYECLYQSGVRASDITLWDCWGTEKYAPEWDDNKGTTNVISWTEKGIMLLTCSKNIRVKEIGIKNIDASLDRNGSLPRPEYDRKVFIKECDELSAKEFINKYAPITLKVRMKSLARETIHILHLHNSVRKIIHKLRKIWKGKK